MGHKDLVNYDALPDRVIENDDALPKQLYSLADGTMRRCIIGAGASGLCSARHFTAPESKHFQVQSPGEMPRTWRNVVVLT